MANPEMSNLDAESRRLRAQAALTWQKEARTLSWLGLQDGMEVLELGCGPGFITEQLLDLLPHGRVTALDIAPGAIASARQYLHGKADDRLTFVQASIMDTGLPENSYDFAIARFIFQHLPDPLGAAEEVRRVLRPGGKLAIIDSDDGIVGIIDPPVPGMQTTIEKFGKVQESRGGNRLVGRRLLRILKSAGFTGTDFEVVAAHSDALGLEPFLPQFSPGRLLVLTNAGLMSEQDVQDARAEYDAFLNSPEPMIMMLLLLACGAKQQ